MGQQDHGSDASTVTIATYDTEGVVTHLSHAESELGFCREDVIGTRVTEWGNSTQHLASVMFEEPGVQFVDIHWSKNGTCGVTRSLMMRLSGDAKVVAASFNTRQWKLTDLERETVCLIANGSSVAQAAEQTHRTECAAKATLARVRDKVGAKSTAHAVAICCWCGVV